MAELLDSDPASVEQHYKDAVEEVKQEMQELPEGPLLMAQIVLEGYSRFVNKIMKDVHGSVDKMKEEEDPSHGLIQNYYRLGLDALDSLTDRMEKYGLLPIAPKSARSQGGVRASSGPSIQDVTTFLREVAAEQGIDLEEEAAKMIDESVK